MFKREYVVMPGDSIRSITEAHYDNKNKWKSVYLYNAKVIGTLPSKLQSGTVIHLPRTLTRYQALSKFMPVLHEWHTLGLIPKGSTQEYEDEFIKQSSIRLGGFLIGLFIGMLIFWLF